MAETISGGGRNVESVQEVDALAEISPRHVGSDGERRAARHLAARLEDLGRKADTEPTRVHPGFAVAHLIHALAGIVGSVLSVYEPRAGFLVVALAAASAFGDLTGTFHAVRRFTGTRASQNVISDSDTGKPGLLILVAHYDAPRAAMLADPRLRQWPRAFFWSLAVIAGCALARVVGLEATWLTVIQFVPTVALIASCPLFVDAALAETSRGANDNASGVATVLRLARRYSGGLEHFDLMVVFTGASAHFALGMRGWLKRHRRELNPTAVAVISVDAVGAGTPVYAVKEGPVFASRMHPTLVAMCSESEIAAPYVSRELSDAYAARAAGFPALRISGRTAQAAADDVDPEALARSYDLLAALVERIDAEVGPDLAPRQSGGGGAELR